MKINTMNKLFIAMLLSITTLLLPAVDQNLWQAVKDEDLDRVEKAVAGGANVNAQDNQGGAALLYACLQGNLPIIKFLLANNADPNIKSKKNLTPLLALVMSSSKKNGGIEQVFREKRDADFLKASQLLIDAGAHVNEQGGIYGETPLIRAVRSSNEPMAQLLLVYGKADPNIPELKGEEDFRNVELTPLLMAVKNGDYLMVDLLLRYKTDVNVADTSGKTALMYAIDNLDTAIVDLLLSYKANVNAQDEVLEDTPLTIAVQKAGDSDVKDNVLLRKAALWVIEQLLAKGANVSIASDNGTPLQLAEETDDDEVIELINRKKMKIKETPKVPETSSRVRKLIAEFEAKSN